MKITNLKKRKQNQYEIIIEKEKDMLYDDIIVKYALLPNKEITKQTWEKIKKENNQLGAYYEAIHYLNTKMRTKKEVNKYLKKCSFASEEIEFAIQKLEKEGYLDERKYLEAYLSDALRFSNDGPKKMKQKLTELGLSQTKITEMIQAIPKEIWQEKIVHLLQKKADSTHHEGLEIWKRKCIEYMKNLGYDLEEIISASNQILWKQDESIIQKEREKLTRKWMRKLTGKELEFQVDQKLYQKGFTKEEIIASKKEP